MRLPIRSREIRAARIAGLAVLLLAATPAIAPAAGPKTLDFNRDVRPILSENCYACHGPDAGARKAKLRLDRQEDAFLDRDGHAVIVPGNVEESELVFRLELEADDEQRMPPPESGKTLTPEQIQTLKTWIAQGAQYQGHWSFARPSLPTVPEVSNASWPKNPIDTFILARLESEGLAPSPQAEKTTLIRRATLDLTGLPPTPAEVDAFLADESPDAFEKLVDRLLASPRFGEHMARYWLDLARYGDTHGLHLDNYREIWPYRDWVIKAFNENKPFDRFVIEQLAGDLLPDPTTDQLVATGYNRCHITTSEGGSIEEEVYVRNVVDQVETNGTVFLGLSIGCARCHDHKYDPVTQKDFYQLFAFFNNIDGSPMDGNSAKHAPIIQVPTPEQAASKSKLEAELADARKQAADALAAYRYDESTEADRSEYVRRADFVWLDDAVPAGAKVDESPFDFVSAPEYPAVSGEKSVVQTHEAQGQRVFTGADRKLKVGEGDVLFAYVFIDPVRPPKEVMIQWNTGEWKHRAYWGENLIAYGADGTPERLKVGPLPTTGKWVRLEVEAARVGIKPGTAINGLAFTQHGGTVYWDKAGIETFTPQDGATYETFASWIRAQRVMPDASLSKDLQAALKLDRSKRSDEQRKALRDHFVRTAYAKARPIFEPIEARIASAEKDLKALNDAIPTTLVFRERKELKPAFVLKRGEYDQKADPVERVLPGFLPSMPKDAPRDRLGLAQWLVSPENPLTARVAVNRYWQQLFGVGLVKTAEDFGLQGEPPSHPELLDWLAVGFREGGWDVKGMLRQMVTSATYRQSSRVRPEHLAKDPSNRLLARGPRFRLDAEVLRDQALAVSDLLVDTIGGPSVKPPQPAGLWEAVGYTSSNTAKFVADKGPEKVHRRSMYTFWKRTSPPPQMTTFDAPSREACTIRRERTNTPLQALLLMNEPQFVEASRALAERVLREGGSTTEDRLAYLFRIATARRPDATEKSELGAALADFLSRFEADPAAAAELIAIGETKADPRFSPGDLAAWTMLANVVLNLDEVLTKG